MEIVIDNRPTDVVIQEQSDRIADLEAEVEKLRDVLNELVCLAQTNQASMQGVVIGDGNSVTMDFK